MNRRKFLKVLLPILPIVLLNKTANAKLHMDNANSCPVCGSLLFESFRAVQSRSLSNVTLKACIKCRNIYY